MRIKSRHCQVGLRGININMNWNVINIWGVDYRGVLTCLDGYMNIALEQTEVIFKLYFIYHNFSSILICDLKEYVNGQLKNKYGDAFIRGNNVLYISTQKRRWSLIMPTFPRFLIGSFSPELWSFDAIWKYFGRTFDWIVMYI